MLKHVVLNLEPRTIFNHHDNLPNSFRMLLIGSSGSGKTTLLFQMLIEPDFIDFDNIIIFTTTPKQQEYQLLYYGFTNGLSKTSIAALVLNQKDFQNIPISILCKEYSKILGDKDKITITLSSNTNDIIHPDMIDKKKKHLIIFDDCVNDSNQVIMSQYFSRGRHSNCNCIYLSQSYFDLNRSIRLNSNFLILFKLSQRNKVDIYNNIVSTIMEKNKFFTFADNVWSIKYRYIVINRDDNFIYADIFIEQKRDTKITDEYYLKNEAFPDEYMRPEKTAEENIKQISDVIQQRELLKNKFQTHDLTQRGMYEQAAKLQEPTIKAIRETQEVEKKEDVKQFPENKLQNMYKNLHKNAAGSAYALIQTKQTFYVNNLKEEFDVWKFNSTSRGNVGRFILFTNNNKEYIWNKTFDQSPLQLSPGLNEILFNNAANHNIIQSEDIKKWEHLIIQAGLGSSYKSSKIYRDILSHPVVEEVIGDGLKCDCSNKTEIIPSKREDLINELNLQLQATEAGHNNTFNYSNALMKEMLKQKIIKSRDYREILRNYFHI